MQAKAKATGRRYKRKLNNKADLNPVQQAVEDALQQWILQNGRPPVPDPLLGHQQSSCCCVQFTSDMTAHLTPTATLRGSHASCRSMHSYAGSHFSFALNLPAKGYN